MNSSNNLAKVIPLYLGIFLLITGLSYFLFDKLLPIGNSGILSPENENQISNNQTTPVKKEKFSGPKTEVCPINGDLFTKEEKAIWETRRPLMVMIENHSDARPQSGLQNADIVYETVAEGGITRFMGVFYCGAVKGSENKYDVGPVRSARTYFLDLASEYSDYPLYTHVGGANCGAPAGGSCTTYSKAQALEQINNYGWQNKGTWSDLSQFSLSYKVCRREPERTGGEKATEHTMYCSSSELWNIAQNRGLTNLTEINKTPWSKRYQSWQFKQKDAPSSSIDANNISFEFWSGMKDYSVSWKYDQASNKYLRSNGSKPHIDFNTGEQLWAKNIIVQLTKETKNVDEHMHNLYDVIGSGKGYLFQNGTKTDIQWSKKDRISRTVYKTADGKEVNLVPGMVWVEILPLGNTVNYENL